MLSFIPLSKQNRMGSFVTRNIAILFFVMVILGRVHAQQIQSGPLVGHTTQNSVTIWAFQGQGELLEVVVHPTTAQNKGDTPATKRQSQMMLPRANANGSSLITITNLEHSTKYTYDVLIRGSIVAQGQFKTAPRRGPIEFQYLLTSCINVEDFKGYPNQPVWDVILEKKPDFAMLAGDTIYLTGQDWDENGVRYDRVWYRNMRQRDERHFANFIQNVPTYAAWDDHEYGSNNAERNQKGKENSLRAWKDLWANPSYGLPDLTGNFYSYYWGNVQFIVMDNRWYRNRSGRTQFGDAQKQWLYQQLEESVAVFKVIVAGCDILEAGFGKDVDDIGRFVSSKKIFGVVFNAGDIHRNEFKTENKNTWPYPVYQFSSSGIARDNWMRPWSMIHINTNTADPIITARFYGANSRNDYTTWSNDPNLECSTIPRGTDFYKDSRCTQTIRLSDVTPNGANIPKWTFGPTVVPSANPSMVPSFVPSASPEPSSLPSQAPTDLHSAMPSDVPSVVPSMKPSNIPSMLPSEAPSSIPSTMPSVAPSFRPSMIPSNIPSMLPSEAPSSIPSTMPSVAPSFRPSMNPSNLPSMLPSVEPSSVPSQLPSSAPSGRARYNMMTLSYPRGGDTLIANTEAEIAWDSLVEGIGFVHLEYCLNDDEPWTSIADGVPNTGTHMWKVPNQNTDRMKIRVIGHSGIYGENDGFLSIILADAVEKTLPFPNGVSGKYTVFASAATKKNMLYTTTLLSTIMALFFQAI